MPRGSPLGNPPTFVEAYAPSQITFIICLPLGMRRLDKCGILNRFISKVSSISLADYRGCQGPFIALASPPTPLEDNIMAEQPTMKYCPHIECGGKSQPHSVDSATGKLDCDGPCSPRRVQMWKDSLKPTKQPKPKLVYQGPVTKEVWEDLCYWKQ